MLIAVSCMNNYTSRHQTCSEQVYFAELCVNFHSNSIVPHYGVIRSHQYLAHKGYKVMNGLTTVFAIWSLEYCNN